MWALLLTGCCCCFLAACASAQNEITKEPGLLGPSGTELPGPDCPWKKRAATLVPSFTKTTTPLTTTHHPRTTQHHTSTHHPHNTTTPHPRTTHHHTSTHHPHNTTTPHPRTTQHHTSTHHPHNTTTPHPRTTQHHTSTHHPHNTTTHHPSTTPHPTGHAINHTTAPVNHTTPPHTPAPTQLPFVPIGDYRAWNGSATCLRMEVGLQIQVRYRAKDQKQQLLGVFAIQPNHTQALGNCSSQLATLDLRFPEGRLLFTFLKNDSAKTFYLNRVQANLTYQFPRAAEATFGADNASLREFEAHLGHSYQCGNRSLALTPDFHLGALQEQVQAFELKAGQFGPAEFCQEPRRSAVVPIVVGVVLGLLIVIVLVAYAVGRWRTHRGYQTI